MSKTMFHLLWNNYSEKAAYRHVEAITRYHRVQASPGFRDAANYTLESLKKAGLEAYIESYPANTRTMFWANLSCQEWDCQEGMLSLLEPADQAAVLADFCDVPHSLIQRSTPFEGDAELVLLEDGLEESEYEGLNLQGKVVLTRGNVEKVRKLAVEKYGALGIVFYGTRKIKPVREAVDLPDALQNTSFWWSDAPAEKKCFGFTLSYRQGLYLAQLVRNLKKEGKPAARVNVKVKSRLYDGSFENVVALIRGRTAQEIVVTAHLCHPQPSANDNASGSAAILEAACCLQRLIDRGELPQPERSIRFLWVPEMTGSYAYLSTHEAQIPHMVAGINLDMVGENQDKTGATFILVNPPLAEASFVPALLKSLRQLMIAETKEHGDLEPYALFRYTTTGFMSGSDHYIYSDPSVGVPMPALASLPDKFYHTSADTPDKVDPLMLRRAGVLAAFYAAWIANAGKEEALWLAHEMQAYFSASLADTLQDHYGNSLEALDKYGVFALDCHRRALSTLCRLDETMKDHLPFLNEDASRIFNIFRERYGAIPAKTSPGDTTTHPVQLEWEEQAAGFIPLRLYRGPAGFDLLIRTLPEADQKTWSTMLDKYPRAMDPLIPLAEYWADGKRTALEIIDLIELENGLRDAEVIVRTYKVLAKLGLMEMKRV